MGIVATILMVLVFPLNSLLVFQGDWIKGKEKQIEINKAQAAFGPVVKGDESTKEAASFRGIAIKPTPEIKPIRKTDFSDLAIANAHSSLVLDAASGGILHYENAKEQRQIASLTKIMTAVLVIEKIKDLNEPVTIGEEEVYIEGTKVGCPRSGYCVSQRLKIGEQVKAGELLKAMLMNSANDAATALGKHISGSTEAFVDLMNKKAKEMDLGDTHFCTPSGLEPEGRESECYSSAYDIGRVAAYSLKYDTIWSIFRLPNDTVITSVDGKTVHHILNTDQIMGQIPNLVGGKTGFTPLAGRSLLMAAKDPSGKHTVVAVLLDDPYRWQDIKTMFDWTFKSYSWN